MYDATFETRFKALTGQRPFPWQINLYEDWFVKGEFPRSCNLPTGLGKTSVVAIWLIALMDHPHKMPRRLVYVVNRRTVVDQTTDEVERLRQNVAKLGNVPAHTQQLVISTLRGQFADNREWSADPSRPAVICGTVDMIGSRLLFSGYGVGFKTKPLHAGFLGQDALLVHDEAHLEPAFQDLIVAIEREQSERERSEQMPWPKLRVMELTATSRGDEKTEKRLGLTDEEKNPPEVVPDSPIEPIHYVWRRQKAKKALRLHGNDNDSKLADEIARLALEHKDSGRSVLVFLRMIEDVEKVANKLPKELTERLTGTLRGLERDALVKKTVFQRFLPKSNRSDEITPAPGTVYLVCTSAGEVGVNISADHMVCDLSTFESMTQRLGRVNRFGDRDDTRIDIVPPKQFGKEDKNGKLIVDELDRRRQKTLELLKQLNGDASPGALGKLEPNDCLAAFAPPPAILPVTDILFDAWALTTISPPLVRTPLPGRPPVEPYLHGISNWQPPETYVAWREEVEVIRGDLLNRYEPEDLLEDYPLKPHELLRDRSDRVFKHLEKISAQYPEAPVWIVDLRDRVVIMRFRDLIERNKSFISYATVLLPPFVGGLNSAGMLDSDKALKKTADEEEEVREAKGVQEGVQYDVADEWYLNGKRMRKRLWGNDSIPDGMMLEREIRIESLDDEDAEPIKVWRWFVKRPDTANARGRDAYLLEPHLSEVGYCASSIVRRLELPNDLAQAVVLAASCHDLGKRRERWQRGLGNDGYPKEVYAKSGPPLRRCEFVKDYYRHEFGSALDLIDTEHLRNAQFIKLSPDMQELTLHLIASHHGRARPHFPADEAFDPERDGKAAAALAAETLRRFARLQRKYGRWGLAYFESLVRAADYAASASPGEFAQETENEA